MMTSTHGDGPSLVGLWVTQYGPVHHDLQANSRYVEARGTRIRAYIGRH